MKNYKKKDIFKPTTVYIIRSLFLIISHILLTLFVITILTNTIFILDLMPPEQTKKYNTSKYTMLNNIIFNVLFFFFSYGIGKKNKIIVYISLLLLLQAYIYIHAYLNIKLILLSLYSGWFRSSEFYKI